MEKTDCFYYDNLTGCCKKGLPGTRCEIEGCVAYYPKRVKRNCIHITPGGCGGHLDNDEGCPAWCPNFRAKPFRPINAAAKHLSKRVDQYLIQGCSRAELKAANDALKKLLQ